MRTRLSLQIWQEQGDFHKLQRAPRAGTGKSCVLPKNWMEFSLVSRAGKRMKEQGSNGPLQPLGSGYGKRATTEKPRSFGAKANLAWDLA